MLEAEGARSSGSASSTSTCRARAATSGSTSASARTSPRTASRFAVWAPNARGVSVVGDWNRWDGRANPLEPQGSSGIWAGVVARCLRGHAYKFEVHGADGQLRLKADPFAFHAEVPPKTASSDLPRRATSGATTTGSSAAAPRAAAASRSRSTRCTPSRGGSGSAGRSWPSSSSRYADELGFTHVELLPVMHHPFSGSWGYQVTGFYAPRLDAGRAGRLPRARRRAAPGRDRRDPRLGAGALPARRVRARALRRHRALRARGPAPRRASRLGHARLQLRPQRGAQLPARERALLAREFHADGLRVDAVASMLYLDYSRKPGEWVPNVFGGRENLEAVAFLRELNEVAPRPRARRPLDRRGVDRVAGRLAADVPRRARLRLQVEHGLDARHARVLLEGAGAPPLPPPRADLLAGLRLERELRPAALARRGRPRQALAAREDARRPLAALREPARALRLHVGAPRQAAPLHGRRVRARRRSGASRRARSTGTCSTRPTTPACWRSSATSTRVYDEEPALWELDHSHEGFLWLEPNAAERERARVRALLRGREALARLRLQPLARRPRGLARRAAGRGTWREVLNTDSRFYGGTDVGNGLGSRPRRCRGTSRSTRPRSRCRRSASSGSCPRRRPEAARLTSCF